MKLFLAIAIDLVFCRARGLGSRSYRWHRSFILEASHKTKNSNHRLSEQTERLTYSDCEAHPQRNLSDEESSRIAFFGSTNFCCIATDANGVIQDFNVGAERMLGYLAAEVVGATTLAGLSDPQELVDRMLALSLELGIPVPAGFEALVFKASRGLEDVYQSTYLCKDGSPFHAVVAVTARRDSKKNVTGFWLIATDNSARKLAEDERMKLDQRLRDQQFYTRSLIEANIDAIFTTDPQGIITEANHQMQVLTGCTRDELIGAPCKGFFTHPHRVETGIKLALAEGKVTDYELTALHRNGKETVVSYNATTFFDRDRKLQGVFVAARDVTASRILDHVLQEKNLDLQIAKVAAEKANLSKSDFLSSMSHELRSPLNAILGFAQLMESESPPPTANQLENTGRILQAGWHLLNLINEILDLAKIESGKFSLSPEPVSLAEVFAECEGMIEGQALKHDVRVVFPGTNDSCFVHADRTRLKQVLLNLLSNAIKYNREHGTVVVSSAMTVSGCIRIRIEDSGAGLAPEKLAQLFQPFNRLGQETSGEEGTGIGLMVAKQLIEMMGGRVGVESIVEVGSIFWFELIPGTKPTSVPPAEQPAPPRSRGEMRSSRRKLLYVEDNPANLALVEQLVARRPELCLLSATTGRLGIELARANVPELILMDINLPDISGIEVLRILREDPATSHIPIVAISANAAPHDIALGLKAGFDQYLTKPIKIVEFNETLDQTLDLADHDRLTNLAEPVK